MDARVKGSLDVKESLNLVSDTRIPPGYVYGIVVICLIPFLLSFDGVDFSSSSVPLPAGMVENLVIDDLFYRLSGAFTHTILEWSAFAAAIFIACLSFAHYRLV